MKKRFALAMAAMLALGSGAASGLILVDETGHGGAGGSR